MQPGPRWPWGMSLSAGFTVKRSGSCRRGDSQGGVLYVSSWMDGIELNKALSGAFFLFFGPFLAVYNRGQWACSRWLLSVRFWLLLRFRSFVLFLLFLLLFLLFLFFLSLLLFVFISTFWGGGATVIIFLITAVIIIIWGRVFQELLELLYPAVEKHTWGTFLALLWV